MWRQVSNHGKLASSYNIFDPVKKKVSRPCLDEDISMSSIGTEFMFSWMMTKTTNVYKAYKLCKDCYINIKYEADQFGSQNNE